MTENDKALFLEVIKTSIEAGIAKNVNGKIDKLHTKLDGHIEDNIRHNEMDKEWKANAQPMIDTLNNLSGTGKFLVILASGVATIIGATFAVKEILK